MSLTVSNHKLPAGALAQAAQRTTSWRELRDAELLAAALVTTLPHRAAALALLTACTAVAPMIAEPLRHWFAAVVDGIASALAECTTSRDALIAYRAALGVVVGFEDQHSTAPKYLISLELASMLFVAARTDDASADDGLEDEYSRENAAVGVTRMLSERAADPDAAIAVFLEALAPPAAVPIRRARPSARRVDRLARAA